jgi:hypothetical protein
MLYNGDAGGVGGSEFVCLKNNKIIYLLALFSISSLGAYGILIPSSDNEQKTFRSLSLVAPFPRSPLFMCSMIVVQEGNLFETHAMVSERFAISERHNIMEREFLESTEKRSKYLSFSLKQCKS